MHPFVFFSRPVVSGLSFFDNGLIWHHAGWSLDRSLALSLSHSFMLTCGILPFPVVSTIIYQSYPPGALIVSCGVRTLRARSDQARVVT